MTINFIDHVKIYILEIFVKIAMDFLICDVRDKQFEFIANLSINETL